MGERGIGPPVVLDAGALIALERRAHHLGYVLESAGAVHIPAGALAQAWRHPRHQARLSRLINAEETTVHPLDEEAAEVAGHLCALSGTADIVDASVAHVALRVKGVVFTSDPDDIARLAPELRIRAV